MTLHEDPTYSCNTKNLYSVHIKSKLELDIFEGRVYKTGKHRYSVLTQRDTHLIGKTLEFRSPATCGTIEEGKVCRVCYGPALYAVNRGIHAGIYAAIESNENQTQLRLSAKHALDTKSAELEMIDPKMFIINQNGWLFNLNDSIDARRYDVVFNTSEVFVENENNYERYDNYFVNKMVFRNKDTGEEFDVHEKAYTHLYFSKQVYKLLAREKFFTMEANEEVVIPMSKFSCNDPFMFLRISNKELAQPLKELAGFIQRGTAQFADIEDYNQFITKLNGLYRAGGITIPSVHIEMLVRNLLRSTENDLVIPDWIKEQNPGDYKIMSLNDAIVMGNSVTLGLMFEKVKKQLRTPKTYQKTEPSLYSPLFINE